MATQVDNYRGQAAFSALVITSLLAASNPTAQQQHRVQTRLYPPLREIGAVYFETLNESQVWINIEPITGIPAPFQLNVTVAFAGNHSEGAPNIVRIRADGNCRAFPTRIGKPILRLMTGDGLQLDLTHPGAHYEIVPHCSKHGPLDSITAEVPFASFRQLAVATDVTVEALGFPASPLGPDALAAWRRLVETVENGTIVRPAG